MAGGAYRELPRRWHGDSLSGGDPSELSAVAARRRAVARQRGRNRHGASAAHRRRHRPIRARTRIRTPFMEHRRRNVSRRPDAAADDRRSTRGRLPERRSCAGVPEASPADRESVIVSAFPALDDSRVGIPRGRGGAHRLRAALRRQQPLRERLQSRLRRVRLPGGASGGGGRGNPSRRPCDAARR